ERIHIKHQAETIVAAIWRTRAHHLRPRFGRDRMQSARRRQTLGDYSLLICSERQHCQHRTALAPALALDFCDTRPNDAFDQRGWQRSVERELDRAFRCLEI